MFAAKDINVPSFGLNTIKRPIIRESVTDLVTDENRNGETSNSEYNYRHNIRFSKADKKTTSVNFRQHSPMYSPCKNIDIAEQK